MLTSDSAIDLPPEHHAEGDAGTRPDVEQVLQFPDLVTEPEPDDIDLLLDKKLRELESEIGEPAAEAFFARDSGLRFRQMAALRSELS